MGWAFAALLIGAVVSVTRRVPEPLFPWLTRLTTLGLVVLLFTMGAGIGSNPAVLGNLQTLGYQAALLALSTSTGSVVAVWLLHAAGALRPTGAEAKTSVATLSAAGGSNHSLTAVILISVASGILAGGLGLLPGGYAQSLTTVGDLALGVILLGIGLEIGHSRASWQALQRLGLRAFLVPAGIAAGSLAGALLAGAAVSLPTNEAAAVGAGFGWYSLSGVLLAQIYSVPTGALAFLANVFRELLAVVTMPLLAQRLVPAVAMAPGGATTMDTTLPIIVRSMGTEAALLAFASGATLTLLVPVLVPILIKI